MRQKGARRKGSLLMKKNIALGKVRLVQVIENEDCELCNLWENVREVGIVHPNLLPIYDAYVAVVKETQADGTQRYLMASFLEDDQVQLHEVTPVVKPDDRQECFFGIGTGGNYFLRTSDPVGDCIAALESTGVITPEDEFVRNRILNEILKVREFKYTEQWISAKGICSALARAVAGSCWNSDAYAGEDLLKWALQNKKYSGVAMLLGIPGVGFNEKIVVEKFLEGFEFLTSGVLKDPDGDSCTSTFR